jgi:hypothetical protein
VQANADDISSSTSGRDITVNVVVAAVGGGILIVGFMLALLQATISFCKPAADVSAKQATISVTSQTSSAEAI